MSIFFSCTYYKRHFKHAGKTMHILSELSGKKNTFWRRRGEKPWSSRSKQIKGPLDGTRWEKCSIKQPPRQTFISALIHLWCFFVEPGKQQIKYMEELKKNQNQKRSKKLCFPLISHSSPPLFRTSICGRLLGTPMQCVPCHHLKMSWKWVNYTQMESGATVMLCWHL